MFIGFLKKGFRSKLRFMRNLQEHNSHFTKKLRQELTFYARLMSLRWR